MSTMNIAVNVTTLDADDRRAARVRVTRENDRIARENAQLVSINYQRAQNVSPLAPIPDTPLLLMSTGAELKTSYESMLAKDLAATHASAIVVATQQAADSNTLYQSLKAPFTDATLAKQQAATAAALAALA